MKNLRGFRKKYFSLSAITMFATVKKLNDSELYTKSQDFINKISSEDEESACEDELLLCATSFKEVDSCKLLFTNSTGTAPILYNIVGIIKNESKTILDKIKNQNIKYRL